NSSGLGGKLVGNGTTSVSLDGLQLTATNMTGLVAVFFQGTGVVSFTFRSELVRPRRQARRQRDDLGLARRPAADRDEHDRSRGRVLPGHGRRELHLPI